MALVVAYPLSQRNFSQWYPFGLGAVGRRSAALPLVSGTPRLSQEVKAVVWGALAIGVMSLVLFASTDEAVRERLQKSAGLFSTDIESIDNATAQRVSIWQVAMLMEEDHWLTGVGPRGFRYVFMDYAPEDNYWKNLRRPLAPNQPHLVGLEVLVETGVVGIVGFLVFFWVLITYAAKRTCGFRSDAVPWLIAALVALFPLNTYLALYASYWSSLSWWLLLVALAMMSGGDGGERDNAD